MLDGDAAAPCDCGSMNAEFGSSDERERWPAHFWWGVAGLVLAAQVALIFWLGDQGPTRPGSSPAPFTWQVAGRVSNELLALNDPTLFALPHRESFSGPAWLTITNMGAAPFVWSEPSQWLRPPVEQLGGVFHSFLATNQVIASEAPAEIEPELRFPEIPAAAGFTSGTTFQILGDLDESELLTPFALNSWTNADLLTNSVVQALVNAAGQPISVTLLANSGSSEADRFALKQAELARFAPLRPDRAAPGNPVARLRWVQILFNWHTVPAGITNRPAGP